MHAARLGAQHAEPTPEDAMNHTPRITHDEVRQIALLARLAISDDEAHAFGADLAAILDYAQTLQTLDLTGVEPTTHPVPLDLLLREDDVVKTLTRDQVLQNAPDAEDGLFRVPRAVEGGN